MLYASDLGKDAQPSNLASEDLPEEIPDLVAEILVKAVEQRQRRQLSTGFLRKEAVVSRVRGRIDHLKTSRRQLLARGQVACSFSAGSKELDDGDAQQHPAQHRRVGRQGR